MKRVSKDITLLRVMERRGLPFGRISHRLRASERTHNGGFTDDFFDLHKRVVRYCGSISGPGDLIDHTFADQAAHLTDTSSRNAYRNFSRTADKVSLACAT